MYFLWFSFYFSMLLFYLSIFFVSVRYSVFMVRCRRLRRLTCRICSYSSLTLFVFIHISALPQTLRLRLWFLFLLRTFTARKIIYVKAFRRFTLFIARSHLLSHLRSTIGRIGLNRRVRYGYGCLPDTHRHELIFP